MASALLRLRSTAIRNSQFYFRAMSSKFLIDEPKYSFLKELGLDKVNSGVYDGKWSATGNVNKI
jgi:aldehyde dehydrogenase family 7 member A1